MKDRERAKLANPFTTRRVKEKIKQQAREAANWNPKFCSFLAPQAGSAVAMAMAKSAPVPAVDAEEALKRPVHPKRLLGKRTVIPVKKMNPRPGVSRPSVASQALKIKKRVSFQFFGRAA